MAAILTSRSLTIALQFVAFGTLAARLGPSRLGVYAFGLSFATLFTLATDIGLRAMMTRESAQRPEQEAAIVPNVVYVRMILAPLAYGLMAAILLTVPYTASQRRAGLIAGLILLAQPIESFQATLEIHLKMRWSAMADVVESILGFIGILVLVHRHAPVESFVWLYVAVNALNMVAVASAAALVTHYRWRPEPATWLTLIRKGVPLGIAAVFMSLYYRLDMAILSVVHRGNAVGQYGAGYRFFEVFAVVASTLMLVLAPVLARSISDDRSVALRRYQRALHLMMLLAAPVAIGGVLTATRLVPALPGFHHYHGAGVTLALLAPGAAAISLTLVVHAMLIGAHGQRRLVITAAMCLVVNLALNFGLILPYSYVGAALATTLTEILVLVLSARAVTAIIGPGFRLSRVVRALRASVVLTIALVLTSTLHPFAQVAIGVVAYAVALIPTRSLEWTDLGGMLSHQGMRAQIDTVAPARWPDGTRIVLADTPLGVYRQLQGCNECFITGPVPGWVAPVARLARCARVVDVTGRRRRGLRRLFLDPAP